MPTCIRGCRTLRLDDHMCPVVGLDSVSSVGADEAVRIGEAPICAKVEDVA
jgi:hypothetical protein